MRIRSFALPVAISAALLITSNASADNLTTGDPATTFNITDHVTGLNGLTDFRFLPDGRIIFTEKGGNARIRPAAGGALVNAGTFAVDTESEKGLLGVEVHPSFATNGLLFFYYSRNGGSDNDKHRVVSVKLGADNKLDMTTEVVLVKDLLGPANHDGGALAIGNDGKLYIGVGDTGCNKTPAPPSPPGNYYPTCLTNGNGKILRVELDGKIPADNPLVAATAVTQCGGSCGAAPTGTGAPRKDIWAWGFRNPWRIWNDPVTGNLWVGDVGEGSWEEIDVAKKGRHHGWPWREAALGYPLDKCKGGTTTPDTGDCVDPVFACAHGTGAMANCTSITGGLIVDSCDWPTTFRGKYFFADNVNGRVWTVEVNAARDNVTPGSRKDFGNVTSGVTSMRIGPDRALYLAAYNGRLARVAPKAPVTCDPVDAGPPDASPPADTGTPPADTGTPTDTDPPVTDTGAPPVTDSSPPIDDASVPADGDPTAPGAEDAGGCGCRTQGSGPMPSLGLAALGLLAIGARVRARRKRR